MSQTTATAQPISPLRRRMIEDMTVRGFGEKTQSDYIRHVKNFTIFLGRSPDLAEGEDLRAFKVRQREQGVQPPTMNGAVAALRFFFTTTCGRPELARHLRLVKQPEKLPVVLTQEEVLLLLEAGPEPQYKAALGVAYRASLRVPEVSVGSFFPVAIEAAFEPIRT
jgi:integrase/recombinase XerD